MSVPHVDEQDEVLKKYEGARESEEFGDAFNVLYDHTQAMHSDMLELREGYDRCRKNKGVLILLRKKAIQERDEAREELEEIRAELNELKGQQG